MLGLLHKTYMLLYTGQKYKTISVQYITIENKMRFINVLYLDSKTMPT